MGELGNADADNEARGDNDEWFEDVPQNFQTKSEYMRYKAKNRIRKYYYETTKMLLPKNSKDNNKMKKKKKRVLQEFKEKLEQNHFHEGYFDRYGDETERLCDCDGQFVCQGCHNNNHHINPYLTEENRRTFRFWYFNHRIQIGKEVLPKLKAAVEKTPPGKKVNLDYFYGRLFTKDNFKLVHPACFDGTDYKREVDMTQVFLPV